MRLYILPERCDNCQQCVSACSRSAILSNAQTTVLERTSPFGRPKSVLALRPEINQDICDGCEDVYVPVCLAVCERSAISLNMLV